MEKNTFLPKILYFVDKIGVYLLALVAAVLNISLAFDNVVWGG